MFEQDPSLCAVRIIPEALGNKLNKIFSKAGNHGAETNNALGSFAEAQPSREPLKSWGLGSNPDNVPLSTVSQLPNGWTNSLNMMYQPGLQKIIDRGRAIGLLRWSRKVRESAIYKWIYERRGTYDVAHVRRDDLLALTDAKGGCVNCIVSVDSYKKQMHADGVDPAGVIWISDDKGHRTKQWWHEGLDARSKALPAQAHWWRYPEGERILPDYVFGFLPDLLLLGFARRVYRANSSFSFFGVLMNRLKEVVIYSPDLTTCVRSAQTLLRKRKKEPVIQWDCDFTKSNQNHWMARGDPKRAYPKVLFGRIF